MKMCSPFNVVSLNRNEEPKLILTQSVCSELNPVFPRFFFSNIYAPIKQNILSGTTPGVDQISSLLVNNTFWTLEMNRRSKPYTYLTLLRI